MSKENNLFILKTISIRPKTEENFQKEYKIDKIEHNRPDNYTYTKFIKFLKSWGWDIYYSEDNNCYFTDLSIAKQYTEQNIGDINDGGVYNYIAIVEVPFNCTYAETEIQSIYIFKYNKTTDEYNEVDINFNNETKYIAKKNYML